MRPHLRQWIAAWVFLLAVVSPVAGAPADGPARPLAEVIDEYVRMGLASNLMLADQSLEIERSLAALDAARARFYPELSLTARYTRAHGGREFTVPVSQLLNPAYQTLNELLIAHGGTARFGLLPDESFPLQRSREQDTRVSLRQPLYAPMLPAAAAAARAGVRAAGFGHEALANALRRDVTVAYLGWLKAGAGARIVAESVTLLQENLRVNESLEAHGKVTEDQVLRARAELLGVQQQASEAENGVRQAASYLNFLLNRPLATPINPALLGDGDIAAATQAAPPTEQNRQRAELLQLEEAGEAAAAQLRAARAAWRPTIALGVDAGTQGTDYGFGRDYNFLSASVLFTWTLFDGGARTAAESQARVAMRKLANQREAAAQRIGLEVQQARDNLGTARLSLAAATERAAAARAAFRIVGRKRDEGMVAQIEFLDARNALTSAELNLNWTRFDLLQRAAELDYALATGEPSQRGDGS
jgi:outer membrane protein TolC